MAECYRCGVRRLQAPDPNWLLPATYRLIGRRRARRRIGAIGAMATATALTLATVTLLRSPAVAPGQTSTAEAPPTLATPVTLTGPALQPPTVPIIVTPGLAGLDLSGVTVSQVTGEYAVDYLDFRPSWNGRSVTISWHPTNPMDGSFTNRVPTTVHGQPATAGTGQSTRELVWPANSGLWLEIGAPTGQFSDADLRGMAERLTVAPGTPPSMLRIPHLPAGYQLTTWWSQYSTAPRREADYLELCPASDQGDAAHTCIYLGFSTGSLSTDAVRRLHPGDPLLGQLSSGEPAASPEPISTYGGRVVARQVDATHWVAATTKAGDPLIAAALVDTVSAG